MEAKAERWPAVRKREIGAWAFFDFANSSFTTVMVTVLFPVYFVGVVAPSADLGQRGWGWGGAIANALVVLLGPILGYWADRQGRKKLYLLGTTVVCVVGTILCGWLPGGEMWWVVLMIFVMANVAFLIGENFVASFLPEISTRENVGRISSYGWGIGYLGGLVSLLIAQQCAEVSMAIVITGVFFAVASAPTFIFLRERAERQKPIEAEERRWMNPLRVMWAQIRGEAGLRWMLGIFFLISGGLSTVIYFSSIFAERELGMDRGALTVMFLALQVAAVIGALVTGWMQDRWGWRRTLGISLVVWCATVVGCAWVRSVEWFYVLAAFAGYGIGGTQTCVRAALSYFTAVEDAGKTYAYWGGAGKLAPVVFLPLFGEVAAAWGLRVALGVPFFGFLGALVLMLACKKEATGGRG